MWLALTVVAASAAAEGPEAVGVFDSGPRFNPATWECAGGHQIEKRSITFDSGKIRYTFAYQGCTDPSHGEQRPCAEGNFGMPEPTTANFYWGGFLRVFINGQDAFTFRLAEMRVIEQGTRGACQIVWMHPDAQVGLRLMMLPASNHVLALLSWKPRAGAELKTVTATLTCYPSFFTAARGRKGERHCATPRTDLAEPQVLELKPHDDTYLLYYDAVFDVAKGEGDGPCAAIIAPDAVQSGTVQLTDYPVITTVNLDPQAGQARMAFYDFTGHTNADAAAYLRAHAAEDLAELRAADFRPKAVTGLDPQQLRRDIEALLDEAGDDADPLRPQVQDLLTRVGSLKTQADAGDWKAEADLAETLAGSEDLLWKLRTFAVLNNPTAREE